MEASQTASPEPTTAGLMGRAGGFARALLAVRFRTVAGRSLPRLDDVDPWASRSPRHWRGLAAIPVSEIVGTASYPPGTRQGDFLPRPGSEPADWQARWNRLEDAAGSLIPLPPIELLKAGDGYWVVDGHNRVALAKSTGQLWIDADVTELVPVSASTSTLSAHGGIN